MRGALPNRDSAFVAGVVTTLILLGLVGLGLEVVDWAASRPFPGAIVDVLTTPMFSVVDLAGMTGLLFVLWVVYTMPKMGLGLPR